MVMTIMTLRPTVIGFIAILVSHIGRVGADSTPVFLDGAHASSVSMPLPPEYVIGPDGAVTLRICFNWSCARRQTMTFTPKDMAIVKRHIARCLGTALHDRLQHVRIGIWQMELLAQKYQPLLANDLAINDLEAGVEGRLDCVDSASNTTTYLHILRDIRELAGWTVASPKVRNLFDLTAVHWTAVIIDTDSAGPWSVDSWYRPHGHLPMVMPLPSWTDEKNAWEPPFARMNATPHSTSDLCKSQPPGRLGRTALSFR